MVVASTYLILSHWSGSRAVLKSLKSFFTGVRILPQHYSDVNDFNFLLFSFFLFKWHLTKQINLYYCLFSKGIEAAVVKASSGLWKSCLHLACHILMKHKQRKLCVQAK